MLLYELVQDFDSVFNEQRGRVHVQVWHAVFNAASGGISSDSIKGNNYEIPDRVYCRAAGFARGRLFLFQNGIRTGGNRGWRHAV